MKSGGFIIKYRWWILGFSFILTLAFSIQLRNVNIDPDVSHYIPEKMTSRVNTEKIEDIFGGNEMLMIVFETDDVLRKETLSRIKSVSKSVKKLKATNKTLSLFDSKSIRGEKGAMIVEPAVKRIPRTEYETGMLRTELMENELVYELVVSADFRLSAIIMVLNKGVDNLKLIDDVQSILAEHPGPEQVYLGGLPYLQAITSRELSKDFKVLLPGGLILMLIMLYVFFRQKRGVFLPFAVVLLSITFSIGIMPLLGWEMSIITLLLPIILIAVANDYGIHIIAKYQELVLSKQENGGRKELARKVYKALKTPVLFTGITTLAGILSLLSHKMIPAKQLGILAAAGICMALLLSLLLIPAVLSFLRVHPPEFRNNTSTGWLEHMLLKISGVLTTWPKRILLIFSTVVLVSSCGLFFLKVDTNIENFFPEKHAVRTGSALINKHFGGSQTISLVVEGDIKDPEIIKRIERYKRSLSEQPGVGNVLAISDVILEMSKALNDPEDEGYNQIPDSGNAIAQYFELYAMSGDPEDFEQLVDFDYKHAQIIVRLSNGSNTSIKNVLRYARSITASDQNLTLIGGYGYVVSELADIVVNGQMLSLLFAVVVIMILVMVLFRSVRAGLISVIPLISAIILLFGLMGILGIRLDLATALLSSMMIGIGVDYTIHFLWRYKVELAESQSPEKSVAVTLQTTGRGILFNALSVILGFVILVFSSFPPIRFFGFLIVISIGACLIGALMVVPAMLLVFRPSLEAGKGKKLILKTRVWWHRLLRSKRWTPGLPKRGVVKQTVKIHPRRKWISN